MTDLTKSQKKHLRQLAGQCYEKEMSIALEALYEDFQKWKALYVIIVEIWYALNATEHNILRLGTSEGDDVFKAAS